MSDLFRAYGKAALYAAGLENKLVLVLALQRSAGLNSQGFSREYERLEKKTLGALINESKSLSLFAPESDENLHLVLEYRNWMVHQIPRDMLGFVLQKDGQSLLEGNLLAVAEFFSGVSELVYEKILELAEERGISEALVTDLVARAFSEEIEPNKPLNPTPESDAALRGKRSGGAG